MADLKKSSILIVDDTPDNLRLLSAILTAEGYKVRKALNGKTALRTIQTTPPDLILLDINMPEMNGYEVCQKLKESPNTQPIPVIFISALNAVSDKVKAFAFGGVDYITKPFQGEEVLARVANHLSLRSLQKALQIEQEKSERLLLNILPKTIADQLKEGQNAVAEQFETASFLFADIVGFMPSSSTLPPAAVVDLLNQIFSTFDRLTEQYGLEKIRTIGDSYFVAGGLPMRRNDHAEAIAQLALDMQAAIGRFKWSNDTPLSLRIGINTGGPVVAAAIGTKKFAYDVWGDAVNIASRMESQGEAGKIQVTIDTYEQLKHAYLLEKRGIIPVKGKGQMTTYWLIGRKNPNAQGTI